MNQRQDVRVETGGKFMLIFRRMRAINVFLIFAILFAVFAIFSPGHRFLSADNLEIFLATAAEFTMIALAIGMLMIAGEFDLSVGSVLAFCSYAFVKLFETGLHVLFALILTVIIGMLIGLLNGIITVKSGIPSFITTLGGLLMWRGIVLFWSGGLQKGLELEKIPLMYKVIGGVKLAVVPVQFLWLIGILLLIVFFVHFHRFGNWVYVTGDNKLAAKAMGIHTDRIKIICFMTVGAVVGFVSVMQMFRAGTFSARAGEGWELNAVAASVVGGTALSGGIGTIIGVFWGGLVISIIENGLVLLRIQYWWTFTVFGVIIIASVIISKAIEKRRVVIRTAGPLRTEGSARAEGSGDRASAGEEVS
jgi:simple sugar transport system permease protein